MLFQGALPVVVYEHPNRHGYDDKIPHKRPYIRDIAEHEESHNCGENDLGIIINGNLPAGRMRIRSRDRKLAAGGKNARHEQRKPLKRRHIMIIKDQIRNGEHTGKNREEQHNESAVFPFYAEPANARISAACRHSAGKAGEGRQKIHIAESGFYNEQRADKRNGDRDRLFGLYLFFNKDRGKNQREKRAHFIEHGGVGQFDLIQCVKIAEYTRKTRGGTNQQMFQTAFFGFERIPGFYHGGKSEDHGNKISEKHLLHGGQIAGKAHKSVHPRKTERRENDEDHAFGFTA